MVEEKKIEETVEETADLKEQGRKIVRNHMLASMGVGLVPMPIVDLVGITGVQINMVRKLSKIYGVPFSEHKLKNILSSLIGGSVSVPIAGAVFSLVKFIPVVGSTFGALSMSVSAGSTTYAVGKVFHQHFASGGTFLTFNPDKVREYYNEMLKKGRAKATEAKA
ncbi:DUF697 domain-containing protein [Desulfobacterales bacterium HSG16]|nr:DUF697 domain-containing protein [Desulfobacterales bacterium HSG16]